MFDTINKIFGPVLTTLGPKDWCIFGGFPRDMAADIDPKGDLDICIKEKNYNNISYQISKLNGYIRHNKWITLAEAEHYGFSKKNVGRECWRYSKNPNTFIIEKIYDTRQIDLIRWEGNPEEIGSLVDFVCCGMIICPDGILREAIDGAYKDCINKIARVNYKAKNNFKGRIDKIAKRFKKRIDKFESMGWTVIT